MKDLKGLRIGKFFGVELFVNKSWLILFGLLFYGFYGMFKNVPEITVTIKCVFTLLSVLLCMATLLAHELAHCLVGRRYNFVMKRMTLFFLGGIAHVEDPDSFYKMGPGGEFKVAIAGPITSFLCAIASWLFLMFMASNWLPVAIYRILADRHIYFPCVMMVYLLANVNFLVGCFNLIPAFPMDGGRILRSVLWRKKGLLGGTKIACGIGRFMGYAGFPLMGFFLFGGLFSIIWLTLIGAFVLIPACRCELENVEKIIKKQSL